MSTRIKVKSSNKPERKNLKVIAELIFYKINPQFKRPSSLGKQSKDNQKRC